jgi:hypothetical protein
MFIREARLFNIYRKKIQLKRRIFNELYFLELYAISRLTSSGIISLNEWWMV